MPHVQRRAARAAFVALAVLLVALGVAVPAHAAPSNDPRGAFHVYETPSPPAGPGENVVALTFDDGPHPKFTPPVLDILARYGVKATFFMLGQEAERHPDLVKRIVAEGHVIANHTWSHPDLRPLDEEQFALQVDHTTEVLQSISGQRITCLRPPKGRTDATVTQRLAARGLTPVLWTADSRDFEKPGVGTIVDSSLAALQPGGVILLHDAGGNRDQTIAALPQVIERIRGAGYRIAPISAPDPHVPVGGVTSVDGGRGSIKVAGWADDPDTESPVDVHVYLDGAAAAVVPAGGKGDPGPTFASTVRALPGSHTVCAYAINAGEGAGGTNPTLGCQTVDSHQVTAFDDLRPLAAKARFVQLRQQAKILQRVALVHDSRRLPWRNVTRRLPFARPVVEDSRTEDR